MIYFAYGSLMNRSYLQRLCPDARPLHRARIPNHRLGFCGRSESWNGGGTAAIRLAVGGELWGGVYEIDAGCRGAIERAGEADGYVWAWTAVETEEGEREKVGLLVKVRDLEESEPSPEYLAVLEEAWRQWGLDPEAVLSQPPGGQRRVQ